MRRTTQLSSVLYSLLLGAAVAVACGEDKNDDAGSAGGTETEGTSVTTGSATDGNTQASATMGSQSGTSVGTDSADSGSSTESGTESTSETTTDTSGFGTGVETEGTNDLDCGGKIYECTDGMDNDMDGKTDLDDPECTGPCDNDEGSFATGIPGDNKDCKQDCFFDGNSGQGDDKCLWDLKCDPANPGGNIGCAYTGGNNCDNSPPNQTEHCKMFCGQFVPNGCDCFGCCEVDDGMGGKVWIFLNGSPDCSLDNLDACTTCTPQIDDCGNPCVPEECEVCFGEDEPPEGCDEPGCPAGVTPCTSTADCPAGYFCSTGCCITRPPP